MAGPAGGETRLLPLEAVPEEGKPYDIAPGQVVAGSPSFVSWDLEKSADGKVVAGIWEASPGAWRSSKGRDWEFCHVISGVAELTEELTEGSKPPLRFKAGDTFVMRPGFVGTWRVIEHVRKSFVIYSA